MKFKIPGYHVKGTGVLKPVVHLSWFYNTLDKQHA